MCLLIWTLKEILPLAPSRKPGEQIVLLSAPKQRRPKVLHVFVDQFGEVLLEYELQPHIIFRVLRGEMKPMVRMWPVRLGEIGSEPDRREISQANRRDC